MLYEQSRDYSAIRLDRVKEEEEEEDVVAGARCRRRGVRCEVSRARVSGARCQYGSVDLRASIGIERGLWTNLLLTRLDGV
jgi:hypothetical protein